MCGQDGSAWAAALEDTEKTRVCAVPGATALLESPGLPRFIGKNLKDRALRRLGCTVLDFAWPNWYGVPGFPQRPNIKT